jgi:hypothetical protein
MLPKKVEDAGETGLMLPEAVKEYQDKIEKLRKMLGKIPKLFPDHGMLGGRYVHALTAFV